MASIPIKYMQEIVNITFIKDTGLMGHLEDRTFMYFNGEVIEQHNDRLFLVTFLTNGLDDK